MTTRVAGSSIFICQLFLFGFLVHIATPSAAADSVNPSIEVIIHPGVTERAVSRASVRSIFGMRLLRWSDGTPIRVFVLEDQHPIHRAFCKEVLDIYPYQLRQSWDRLVFSGIGQAPTEVASEEEMLARVASTPGAIGYLPRRKTHDRVRLLLVR